jgi:hypothetical protein
VPTSKKRGFWIGSVAQAVEQCKTLECKPQYPPSPQKKKISNEQLNTQVRKKQTQN